MLRIAAEGGWIAADSDDHGYVALCQCSALVVGTGPGRVKNDSVKTVEVFGTNRPAIQVADGAAEFCVPFILAPRGFHGQDCFLVALNGQNVVLAFGEGKTKGSHAAVQISDEVRLTWYAF